MAKSITPRIAPSTPFVSVAGGRPTYQALEVENRTLRLTNASLCARLNAVAPALEAIQADFARIIEDRVAREVEKRLKALDYANASHEGAQ